MFLLLIVSGLLRLSKLYADLMFDVVRVADLLLVVIIACAQGIYGRSQKFMAHFYKKEIEN